MSCFSTLLTIHLLTVSPISVLFLTRKCSGVGNAASKILWLWTFAYRDRIAWAMYYPSGFGAAGSRVDGSTVIS